MRILLSYAAEYDKGEGIHFERVLKRLGHQVHTINVTSETNSSVEPQHSVTGFSAGVTIHKVLEQLGGADLFLYIEPLGLVPLGLESSPIPTACVLSDMHRNLEARQTLALLFDSVFLYQCNYLKDFTEHPAEAVHWSPWACDTELFRDQGKLREIDVAFIGQLFGRHSERRRMMAQLQKTVRMNEQRYYLQKEIPDCYSRAKIVVNVPIADDLNCRVFEAMSSGALLLTSQDASGQDVLFKEGEHYVGFSSPEEGLEKVDYYLKHGSERERIAAAGHREVMEKHSLAIRLISLLKKIESAPRQAAPARCFTRERVLRTYARIYERTGQVGTLLGLAARERSHVLRRMELTVTALKSFTRRVVLSW